MKIGVLVTGVGGTVGQSVIKALGLERKSFKVIAVDMNPHSAGLYFSDELIDGSYTVPSCKAPEYRDEMVEIIEKEGLDVVVPTPEPEVRFFSENFNYFKKKGVNIAIPNRETVEVFLDKWKTYTTLKKAGVPVPETRIYNSDDLDIDFPMVVKGRFSAASKDIHFINDSKELDSLKPNGAERIVQEYVPGDEYTVGCLTDSEGDLIGILPMKRELYAGVSYKAVTIKNNYLEDLIGMAIKKLKITGPVNFQLKIPSNQDFEPKIFEVNPRFSSTVYYQAKAGFNAPNLSLKDLCGREFDRNLKISYGLVMLRYWEEVFVKENLVKINRGV